MNEKPIFRTEEGYKAIMAAYEEILTYWPLENQRLQIKTQYGRTHVIASGKEDAPPMMLIHGSSSNSASWMGDVAALSQKFRTYCVDIPGEPGGSEVIRHDLLGSAYAEWLKEVMDGLGIQKMVLMGLSIGGLLSLKFATAYPERVSSLILLSSAGGAPQRASFLFKILPYMFMGERGARKIFEVMSGGEPITDEALRFSLLVNSNFNPVMNVPVLSDDALGRLNMPVLYIAGLKDALLNTTATLKRFEKLLPSLTTKIYPDKGHLILNQTGEVLSYLEKCG